MTAQQLALVLTRWASVLLLVWSVFALASELPMIAMLSNVGGNTGLGSVMLEDPLFAAAPGVALLVGVCGLIFARRIARLLSRGCHPEGHCQRCGYLPPPAATACPECGYRRRAGAVGDTAATPPPASSTGA